MTGDAEESGRETSAEVATCIQRADLLDDLGHHAEAAQELADALRLDPGNPEALATLSMVQLRAGRHRPALTTARAALSAEPDHLLAGIVQGYALAELDRRAETVAAAVAMLVVDRRSWLRQLHFAAIVRRVRNGQSTLDAAWRAVQLAPDEPRAHLVLSAVAGDLGLDDIARRARAEALRLDPRAEDRSWSAPALRVRRRRPAAPDELIGATLPHLVRSRAGVTRILGVGALYAWGGPLLAAVLMLVGASAARVAAALAALVGILIFGTARAELPDGRVPLVRALGRLDRLLAAACVGILLAPAMLLLFAATGWAWPLGVLILLGAFAFAALAVRASDIARARD